MDIHAFFLAIGFLALTRVVLWGSPIGMLEYPLPSELEARWQSLDRLANRGKAMPIAGWGAACRFVQYYRFVRNLLLLLCGATMLIAEQAGSPVGYLLMSLLLAAMGGTSIWAARRYRRTMSQGTRFVEAASRAAESAPQ